MGTELYISRRGRDMSQVSKAAIYGMKMPCPARPGPARGDAEIFTFMKISRVTASTPASYATLQASSRRLAAIASCTHPRRDRVLPASIWMSDYSYGEPPTKTGIRQGTDR